MPDHQPGVSGSATRFTTTSTDGHVAVGAGEVRDQRGRQPGPPSSVVTWAPSDRGACRRRRCRAGTLSQELEARRSAAWARAGAAPADPAAVPGHGAGASRPCAPARGRSRGAGRSPATPRSSALCSMRSRSWSRVSVGSSESSSAAVARDVRRGLAGALEVDRVALTAGVARLVHAPRTGSSRSSRRPAGPSARCRPARTR